MSHPDHSSLDRRDREGAVEVRLSQSHTLTFTAPTAHDALFAAAVWLRENERPTLALISTDVAYDGRSATFTLVIHTTDFHGPVIAEVPPLLEQLGAEGKTGPSHDTEGNP